jgi:hypothetical protein
MRIWLSALSARAVSFVVRAMLSARGRVREVGVEVESA